MVAALALTRVPAITLPAAARAAAGGGDRDRASALSAALYFAPGAGARLVLACRGGDGGAGAWLEPGRDPTAGGAAGAGGLRGLLPGRLLVAPLALLHRDAPHGPVWVLRPSRVTFANDTGAYFAGRALGRHKLYPAISPGKTVEGAVGGPGGWPRVILLLAARHLLPRADRWPTACWSAAAGGRAGADRGPGRVDDQASAG